MGSDGFNQILSHFAFSALSRCALYLWKYMISRDFLSPEVNHVVQIWLKTAWPLLGWPHLPGADIFSPPPSTQKVLSAVFLLTAGSFLLTAELFCLQLYLGAFWLTVWVFFAYSSSFFCLQLSFFSCNGKVCLRSTSTDCKQRSSTVSKKAPTASKKASPETLWMVQGNYGTGFGHSSLGSGKGRRAGLHGLLEYFSQPMSDDVPPI